MDDKYIEDMAKAFAKSPPSADWSKLSDESKEVLRAGMRVILAVVRSKDRAEAEGEVKRLAKMAEKAAKFNG